jgi:hypothetical protein
MENIEQFVKFLQENPGMVIAVFFLSILANLIQVGTYLRDRRKIKKEEKEREHLSRLVETYESVLKIAKDTVDDEDKLNVLKGEIKNKTEYAEELAQRVVQLELMAKKRLVTQAITHNLQIIADANEEIKQLRAENQDIEALPNIPDTQKENIEKEISSVVSKYSLPKEFTFRATLLVVLLLLLPENIERLILPIAIPYILYTAFEAILYFPANRLKSVVRKNYSILIYIAVIGAWYSLLDYYSVIFMPIFSFFNTPTFWISVLVAFLSLYFANSTTIEIQKTFREKYLLRYLEEEKQEHA